MALVWNPCCQVYFIWFHLYSVFNFGYNMPYIKLTTLNFPRYFCRFVTKSQKSHVKLCHTPNVKWVWKKHLTKVLKPSPNSSKRRLAKKAWTLFNTRKWCPNAEMWPSKIVSPNGKLTKMEIRPVTLFFLTCKDTHFLFFFFGRGFFNLRVTQYWRSR